MEIDRCLLTGGLVEDVGLGLLMGYSVELEGNGGLGSCSEWFFFLSFFLLSLLWGWFWSGFLDWLSFGFEVSYTAEAWDLLGKADAKVDFMLILNRHR
jgi:hypothetical protein